MRAIQIPNAALLDVFGRQVAVNNHDQQRASVIHNPSYVGFEEKNSTHKQNGTHSILNNSSSKSDQLEQLTVIGKLRFFFRYENILIVGETPLHIAIVYNDINSVKLLIKHGVDVNKRVVGDFNTSERNRMKNETKKGRKDRIRPLFRRNDASQKPFNPQNENPESKFPFSSISSH